MGLSNAARQARWREKRDALVRGHPEVAKRALTQAADRCGGLSEGDRQRLADRFADAALGHFTAGASACAAGEEGARRAVMTVRSATRITTSRAYRHCP